MIRPAMAFHPSEVIADEAMERGWNIWQLVLRAGATVEEAPVRVLAWQIYAVCDPGCLMGEDGAKELERALGIDAEVWLRMEAAWRANHDRHSPLEKKHLEWFEYGDDDAGSPFGEQHNDSTEAK